MTDESGNEATIKLNSIRRMKKAEGPLGGTPKSGSYFVANLTVKSTRGTFSVNPLFFQLQSSDGTTYQSELGVLDKQIRDGDLASGRQVKGDVAFDAPKGALILDYTTFGSPYATFNITG